MRGTYVPGANGPRANRATCLWPGLSQLWVEGAWSGLAMAFGFACLFNLLLLNSLVWTEWVEPGMRRAGWTLLAAFWLVSAWTSRRWCAEKNAAKSPDPERDLFLPALGEYLKGNWYEAESICQQLLRDKARDAEAELMLATILRHTGRYAAARERLNELKRWDDSAKWEWEIANELERLAEAEQQEPDDSELQAAPASTPLLEAA